MPNLARRCAALRSLAAQGSLVPGADADFVLVNLDERYAVRGAALHSKAQFTPFEGETFCSTTHATWLRGKPVYCNGAFASPIGRFTPRAS